jgi:large subunit ribosomal protein L3
MIQALIGKKLNQTQKFLENGRRIPVTEIAVSDNVVLQVKNVEKDSYTAVQLGYGVKKNGSKALLGHVKKAGLDKASAVVREVALKDAGSEELPKPGDSFSVSSVFKPGDVVDVTGTSKGKGFAGVVKRHNFRGGPKTHGQSDRHRAPGSIGQTTTPGRVYKGKRMAGHMGVETVTVTNLTVVDVDEVNKKLYILGLVPGHKNATLLITQKGEDKKFVPLLKIVDADELVENADVATEVVEVAPEAVETAEETVAEPATEVQEAAVETAAEHVETVSETVDAPTASNAVEEEASEDATSNVADEEVESSAAAADVANEAEEQSEEAADGESKEEENAK